MDRRILATQNKLVAALRLLMQKYPWDSITVATICMESGISRSTFYSHFQSKDELMQLSLVYLNKELAPTDTRRGLASTVTLMFLPALLTHVKDHREILIKNQNTVAAGIILRNLRKTIDGLVIKEIECSAYSTAMDEGSLVFISGGLWAIIERWNETECQEPTARVVARIDRLVKSVLIGLE